MTPEQDANEKAGRKFIDVLPGPSNWYLMNEAGELKLARYWDELDRNPTREWRSWWQIGKDQISGLQLWKWTILDSISVSTVFIGLDHSWEGDPPVVFETMIFGGALSDEQWRYCTIQEARIGHRRAVRLAWLARFFGARLARELSKWI